MIIHSISLFSNSFIEAEDKVIQFLTQSLIFSFFIPIIKEIIQKKKLNEIKIKK